MNNLELSTSKSAPASLINITSEEIVANDSSESTSESALTTIGMVDNSVGDSSVRISPTGSACVNNWSIAPDLSKASKMCTRAGCWYFLLSVLYLLLLVLPVISIVLIIQGDKEVLNSNNKILNQLNKHHDANNNKVIDQLTKNHEALLAEIRAQLELIEALHDNVITWENQQKTDNFRVNLLYKNQLMAYLEEKLGSVKKQEEILAQTIRENFTMLFYNLQKRKD